MSHIQFDTIVEMQYFDYSHCNRDKMGAEVPPGMHLQKSLAVISGMSTVPILWVEGYHS